MYSSQYIEYSSSFISICPSSPDIHDTVSTACLPLIEVQYGSLVTITTSPHDSPYTHLNFLPIQFISISIFALKELFDCPIGFSGHERGITPSTIAVALGACSIERHITLDRTNWGSDQAASLEKTGLSHLVRDIRQVPSLLGDGQKIVYPREFPIIEKLRRK